MSVKIIRILLLVLVVIVTSIFIPYFYWISFSERIVTKYIEYSPILNDFVILDYAVEKYYDREGKNYTREETDELLPISHYTLLLRKDLLPDSLKGIELKADEIRINSIMFKAKPSMYNYPEINLFPLFESQPERFKLEMPDEFFRITNRMEFINCASNTIDENLTTSFSEVLQANEFSFPSKGVYGNPTTRKAFDEGYLVIDSNDKLFHIKRIKNKPYCKKVEIPDDIKIKMVFLREYSLKEYYAYIVTEDNKLFLLLFETYEFQEVPIKDYDSEKDILKFQADLFYRTVTIYKENSFNVYVIDRQYNLIDQYEEKWLTNIEMTAGIVSTYIFPFELSITSVDSDYIDFYFSEYHYSSLYLSILLIVIMTLISRKKKKNHNLNKLIPDLLIILVAGIFGFIAVNFFKYED